MSRTGRGDLACQAPDSVVDTKFNIKVMSPASAKNIRNAILYEILDTYSSVSQWQQERHSENMESLATVCGLFLSYSSCIHKHFT